MPKKTSLLSLSSRLYHVVMKLKCKARRYLSLFSCNSERHGKNKVILIILRVKFLKTWPLCAIGTSLPELQFFSQKNICDKIDFHIARQTW